ncbi:MAG: glycerol-3-phosphate 1-O-acyltransferase PlsY [Planctomycetaceae bacterium]|nr:glycerol-3-phosphate 1-O-acyltransferase PlsY [Planctomycetaceae bacterium]
MLFAIGAFCLAAFLVGGIPFGYLVGGAILRDDIRKHGSGNTGATNVTRLLGWKWGALVLFLDALKGLLPTLAARLLLQRHGSDELVNLAAILTGICCIIGHIYPVWLKLRGGKGVATALGVILVIAPLASGAALVTFLIVLALTRIVGLASIVSVTAFAVAQLTLMGKKVLLFEQLPMTLFSTMIPALIIWKHRSNIMRILRGNEQKLGSASRSLDRKHDSAE